MRTGIVTVPLDYGKCPKWLFERMKKLARAIALAIIEEFGPEEFLKRLSNPLWFQSFGCVIGFDWNSSGLTTTTLGALKEGIRGLEDELGIYICGGKGKTSRKTPEEIKIISANRGFDFSENLIYASKISAKVDSCLIQAGYQIYHHNFVFTKSGKWGVVQQGMNTQNQTARRYHWLSLNIKNFTEEPHTAIVSHVRVKPLNLIAKKSRKNKEVSTELVREEPRTFLKDIKLIYENSNCLIKQRSHSGFCEIEIKDVEFHWQPVLKEKFDLKRLKKIIEKAHFFSPDNFEKLLMIEGVGPKTIRALSLVSEIIYGAKASFEDPARYSFAVGGKDGTPYFVEENNYDKLLNIIEKAIKTAKLSNKEKNTTLKRLSLL